MGSSAPITKLCATTCVSPGVSGSVGGAMLTRWLCRSTGF